MQPGPEHYFLVVPFVSTLYNVDLTFKSVDELIRCDHSNETYLAVFLL